jgi:flagellar FliL protein
MGERMTSERTPNETDLEARIVRARPGLFSIRNIVILVAGVLLSSLLAVLVVDLIIAPSIEHRRVSMQASSSARENGTRLDSLQFFQIEPLIVNPANSNGERYLKASVTLEMLDAEVQRELGKRLPQIKNQINNILSSKTIAQIQTPNDREQLRREILERVNGMLINGRVSNVYFEEFVYQ